MIYLGTLTFISVLHPQEREKKKKKKKKKQLR